MEPKPTKLSRIAAFLGFAPATERFDAPRLIGRILVAADLDAGQLSTEIGVCEDTLANLRSGRYQPSRRTYEKLTRFAKKLDTQSDPCPPVAHPRNSSKRRKCCGTKSTPSRSESR